MKVIIISEALEEPFEIDSDNAGSRDAYSFGIDVEHKVRAIFEAEQMRKATVRDKHSIFKRD